MPNFFSRTISHVTAWALIISVSFFSSVFYFSEYVLANSEVEALNTATLFQADLISDVDIPREKIAPIKVKGLYLTAYSAGSDKKLDSIIKLINETELNAIVVDLKDYSGQVLYDSKIKLVDDLHLQDVRIKDVQKLLQKLEANHIYKIARVSVFQDPLLAERMSAWAIKSKQGGLWRDKNNLAWVDPANKKVWAYVVSVAKEAAKLGFDEINFDYIRFPTDGNLDDIVYASGNNKRYEVVRNFFEYVAEQMKDEPVYISADLFGLTTERKGEDDMRIGQRFDDAVNYFDYVMPMVYPSHYPSGYRGYKNPADYPYEVVYNAVKSGVNKAEDKRAHVRTWIQAFNIGAVYNADKIRAQIKASDDAGADGWVLWNAANRYADKGLELDDK
jgi:hypothetical protein